MFTKDIPYFTYSNLQSGFNTNNNSPTNNLPYPKLRGSFYSNNNNQHHNIKITNSISNDDQNQTINKVDDNSGNDVLHKYIQYELEDRIYNKNNNEKSNHLQDNKMNISNVYNYESHIKCMSDYCEIIDDDNIIVYNRTTINLLMGF